MPASTARRVVSAAAQGINEGAVAGVPQQLSLLVVRADGSQESLTAGVAWLTSNSAVATISGTGMLTPIAPGIVVVMASIDDVRVTANVDVFPRAQGAWSVVTGLGDRADGTGLVITQSASRLSGAWWLGGLRIPLTGTISSSGEANLSGRLCNTGYTYGSDLYEVVAWPLTLLAADLLEGTLEWRRSGRKSSSDCTGPLLPSGNPEQHVVRTRLNPGYDIAAAR